MSSSAAEEIPTEVKMDGIDIGDLMEIIRKDLNGGKGISCSPFSQENVAIVIDGTEDVIGDWNKEVSELDVDELTGGEWSMTEPEDGDYGSIVLEDLNGIDMVKDDFGIGDKSRHRFRKKF